MKSTVVDESLSSFKPMYCSREYQASTRLIQQYEKSTLNRGEYIMKCRVLRANQHAEKCVDGAFQPMGVPEKSVWVGLE